MSYEIDAHYLAARNFVKKFSENFEKDEGYNKTFASISSDKTEIAQRNTIITLLIQVLQKLEKVEDLILQSQKKDIDLDLSKTLKVSIEPLRIKKKKGSPETFFTYKLENFK